MAITTIHPSIPASYSRRIERPSLLASFLHWCKQQQPNRLLWLGIALTVHGCVLTPITFILVLSSGSNPIMFALVIAAMAMTVVSNLAALPTRITIPILLFSVLIDVILVAASLALGPNIPAMF